MVRIYNIGGRRLRNPMKSLKNTPWISFPREDIVIRLPTHPETPASLQGQRIINRDLSWLHFNERVLAEAGDETVPALERLRFATIVSSNLDEFFMIRVAEISRMARRDPSRQFPDGLKPVQLLA